MVHEQPGCRVVPVQFLPSVKPLFTDYQVPHFPVPVIIALGLLWHIPSLPPKGPLLLVCIASPAHMLVDLYDELNQRAS